MTSRVMVVEDERVVAFNLQQRLVKLGYDVSAVAASGEEALRQADLTHPDLVLMDIHIQGDIDGIETATRLHAVSPTPIVYLTAYSEDSTLERARATSPYGYLLKPFSEREMHATIQMALARRVAEVALEKSEEHLRLALEAAEMGTWNLDLRTGEVEITSRSAQILGLDEHSARTTCEKLLGCVDEADRERLRAEFDRSLTQLKQYQSEFPRIDIAGDPHWVRVQGKGCLPEKGAYQVIGVVQDITKPKLAEEEIRQLNEELEQRVTERTSELRASVAELDAFSYSVAHDLRAPVLRIIGFSDALLNFYGEQLDDEGKSYLKRLYDAGSRMGRMIDSLLSLSRLTRAKVQRDLVDLSTLVQGMLNELQEAEPERRARFLVAPRVVASADRELIKVLLDNLLRNAWKFTSKHAATTIEFGTTQVGNETAYFVRDDGAGFDMKYADKLFGAFQRLHTSDEFTGTGIGLATASRVVQRHGGRIWAEGKVEQGATIYFTLQAPIREVVPAEAAAADNVAQQHPGI